MAALDHNPKDFPHALDFTDIAPSKMAAVSSWADGLPAIGADPAAEKIDLVRAFDALEAWILKAPSERSCWVIDRVAGKWRVGLQSGEEKFTASQDAELRGAIRNALWIAKMAGRV